MECKSFGVKKHPFKLKYKLSDGNILQVHHTVWPSINKAKHIRFLSIVFDDLCDRFACSDHDGNIFIFDMVPREYWTLSGHEPCSVVAFAPFRQNFLVLAVLNSPFKVLFVDADRGKVKSKISGHKGLVKIAIFSIKQDLLVTSTGWETVIWELKGLTLYFKLNLCVGRIREIVFAPGTDNIVACFKNDTFKVWCRKNLKPLRVALPEKFKHVKSFAYNANGSAIVIGTSSTLSVHHPDSWQVINCIDLNKIDIYGVQQLLLLPQPLDGGCNQIAAVLSRRCIVHLVDLGKSTKIYTIPTEASNVSKIATGSTGKYLACILQLGQINIYKSAKLIDKSDTKSKNKIVTRKNEKQNERKKNKQMFVFEAVVEVEDKIDKCLSADRLCKILSTYGEYPEKQRLVIWKKLLDTPNNHDAYCDLITRPVHTSCKYLDKCITIHNTIYLKHTKRLISALNYWCPVLADLDYLHILVFPFVKILHKDPMFCFEAVATILKNYCQLWFEYCPLPPINVLAMIENILGEHDGGLLDHFYAVGVTSEVYAFKLMISIFSEVLSSTEWLTLWDHILSNEPSFVLMAVVAYNVIHRNTLKNFRQVRQFEDFYSSQNPVNMKALISKSCELLNDTSRRIHPRRYLKEFSPLHDGPCYSQCNLDAAMVVDDDYRGGE